MGHPWDFVPRIDPVSRSADLTDPRNLDFCLKLGDAGEEMSTGRAMVGRWLRPGPRVGPSWQWAAGTSLATHLVALGGMILAGWLGWQTMFVPPVQPGRQAMQLTMASAESADQSSEVVVTAPPPPPTHVMAEVQPLPDHGYVSMDKHPRGQLPIGHRSESLNAPTQATTQQVAEVTRRSDATQPQMENNAQDTQPAARDAQRARASVATQADQGAPTPQLPIITYAPPRPPFPLDELQKSNEGSVQLVVEIGEDGHVTSAKVFRSSGVERFDDLALNWVRQWRFGAPENTLWSRTERRIRVPVRFAILK